MSVAVLGLGLALGLMAGVPEDEVLVLVTRGAVQMPDGRLQAFLSEVQTTPEVMVVLQEVGAVKVILSGPSEGVVVADALGRIVKVLPVQRRDVRATWDLTDVDGLRVPAGVYVFRQREAGAVLGRAVIVNP